MRPDYLGAYNPKWTSRRISMRLPGTAVVHNVYTQYAGTSLSEPAIWAGALLLHAHYMQPFSKIKAWRRWPIPMAIAMMVSYDTVLSQISLRHDDLIKLDTDKPLWNHFEVCSTIHEAEA